MKDAVHRKVKAEVLNCIEDSLDNSDWRIDNVPSHWEVKKTTDRTLQIRVVGENGRPPRYFTVQVSENV